MQDSSQMQSENPNNALMDERVKICDTHRDIGSDDLLTPSNKCTTDGKGKIVLNSLCPNEKEKKDSQQDESPTQVSTSLMKGLTFDEVYRLIEDVIIPEYECAWRGKFQIHNNNEGITKSCYWLQAHASNYASPKVLEMVAKFPETIKLEELPRSENWPSTFMKSQVTKNDIGLYFFAGDLESYHAHYERLMNHMTQNDLALKGNIDGVELLIYPSNILPEGTQRWNQLLFFWCVFISKKINNSADIPASSSSKPNRPFDLIASPEDQDEPVMSKTSNL